MGKRQGKKAKGHDPLLEELESALESCEPEEAWRIVDSLRERLIRCATDGLPSAAVWERFLRLMHRRGYFVASDGEIETSLGEIEALGPEFDLFRLARALARYDAARRSLPSEDSAPAFPPIVRFAPESSGPP